MRKTIFLALVFLVSFSFISAQTQENSCQLFGEVDFSKMSFCNESLSWELLKQKGSSCLNDFECVEGSCIDTKCQSPFDPYFDGSSERLTLWGEILQYMEGIECNPQNQSYHCEGNEAFLCGAKGVWESQGEVEGVCGYSAEECDVNNPNELTKCVGENYYICNEGFYENMGRVNGKCGYSSGSGGGGSSCTSIWKCTNFSSTDPVSGNKCGTRTCTDARNCRNPIGKPLEFLACNSVNNCGNGICDSGEDYGSCSEDCGAPPINPSKCGDGTCSVDESSSTCPLDCGEGTSPTFRWYLIPIIVILISGILFISLILWRKFHSEGNSELKTISKSPPVNPNKPK